MNPQTKNKPGFKQEFKEKFKEKFKQRYSQLTDWKTFSEISLHFLRQSLRINPLKITTPQLKKRLPWCPEGFFINYRHGGQAARIEKGIALGNLLEHQLGYFYLQEAASMIPPLILQPKPTDLVLDMCASPGSKTTQLAALMKNKGLIIANDLKGARLAALAMNSQRCGLTNHLLTAMPGHFFKKSGLQFDKILVDAPCSATGAIRKSFKTILIWNPHMVKRLAGTQKQLIDTAFHILKPGGTLVYSTCSLEPDEDEAVVDFLLNKYSNAEIQPTILPGLKTSLPVKEFEGHKYHKNIKHCLRIWPQDNDTEGFFVAKIKKLG